MKLPLTRLRRSAPPSDPSPRRGAGANKRDRVMVDRRGVLFVPYKDTLELLSIADAMRVCEEVYRMHARGSVVWSTPPSFKLDVADGLHNHWTSRAAAEGRPGHRRAHLQLFRRRRRNTVGALDARATSCCLIRRPAAAGDRRRALELCHPQRGGGGDRLQMGRAARAEGAGPGRHRPMGPTRCAVC